MPEFQSVAEKEFYEGISLITEAEILEIGKNTPTEVRLNGIQHSLNRIERFNDLVDVFEISINQHLRFQDAETQSETVDIYLVNAEKYIESWKSELLRYTSDKSIPFWLVSKTDQQIIKVTNLKYRLEEKKTLLHSKTKSGNCILFSIDIQQVYKQLILKETVFEQIEFLKFTLENSNIEFGVKFYSNHKNHNHRIPAVWTGLMHAKAGLSKTADVSDTDESAYNIGVEQWKVYCELNQLIKNLELSNLKLTSTSDKQKVAEKNIFSSFLSDDQVQKIFSLSQEINLFEQPFQLSDLVKIFSGTATKQYVVLNNQDLAWLFNALQPKFIGYNWKKAIGDMQCFVGRRGKVISASNLAVSAFQTDRMSPNSKKISAVVSQL